MKSRSHRLSITESHDDWVDGSWTVDCVCGVNFDDGEEMVNCDECGVWVHTSCSRYVKSEKSFACDKCKSKSNGYGGFGNDSEETEVAEFLVELPTKTLKMGHPNPASVSASRPGRLWTDIPLEERVHVQGVPGGDPGMFSGIKMLSVLGPELWKSTGYVPKKFNFRFSEFPCSSDGEVEEKKEELINGSVGGHADQADNEAGALLSLSKEHENTMSIPLEDAITVKKTTEGGGCHELVSPRQGEKLDGENPDFDCPDDSLKERISVQPILIHCGKHKKDSFANLKDQSAKKKGKTHEKEGDNKKRSPHASKEASTFSTNSKQLEISQEGEFKAFGNGTQRGGDVLDDQPSDNVGECATNLASNLQGSETTLRNDISSDAVSKEGNRGDQAPMRSESLSKPSNGVASLTELNGSRRPPVKEEVRDVLQNCFDIRGGSGEVGFGSHDQDPLIVGVTSADNRKTKEIKSDQDSNITEASAWPNKKLKAETQVDDCEVLILSLPLDGVKSNTVKPANNHPESSANLFTENCKANKTSVVRSEFSDLKMHDSSRSLNAGISKTDKSDDSPGCPYQLKQEPTGSEVPVEVKIKSSELAQNPEVAKEILKPSDAVTNHLISSQHQVKVSVGQSNSTSAGIDSSRQKDLSELTVETVKDNSSTNKVRVRSKKLVKEPSRLTSLSEKSQATKMSHTLESRRASSDSKDSAIRSASKLSLAPNVNAASGSGECASSSQPHEASKAWNKAAGSVVSGKNDKFNHSGSHPSSRGNVASMAAPSSTNVPAGLSDEELALLLHQELNSSPRVPRVPRMRHTGSLPQLGCPTASSNLMKGTSSSGGKDHSMSSRRRTKDVSRDGSHHSIERDNEAKKMGRKLSSPDNRRRESNHSMDHIPRRERDDGFIKGVHSMKMTGLSSSLSSSGDVNGHNVSSSHPTSRNSSDDGLQMFGRQTSHTLPGLIAEIMSEGKRMTYEELCNAVLPHWPHLRKHNGERYAYSSHSQAVLDCLRNRSEWARLVDRGPKTSGSRKRRKLDADSVSVESEDDEDSRDNNSKDAGSKSFESQQEDFPKGKRKARKRRRLALRGRGIVRRRRADVVSDEESESFSNSSEDSMSSEEGGETSAVGNEASASSEEVL